MNPFPNPFGKTWLTSSFEAPAQSTDYSLYREDFGSIYSLLNTINNRENNNFMRNEDSSQEHGNEEWSGTSSYEEAQSLLIHGYEDPIKSIKSNLAKNKKLTSKIYNSIPKPIVQNRVVGFVPNVPNALKGLPESMITLEKLHKKRKTISIIYATGGSCGVESDVLASAGAALVSAINLIELSGVQTELSIGFIPTKETKQVIFPTVKIKSYGERFNLQKICFPMIHPAMFRRIGFKYLETCPGMVENFSHGYGRPPELEVLKTLIKDKNTYVINRAWITEHENDIEEILNIVNLDIPVYLTGKAGTGKNVICQQVAEALGLDFYFTNAVTQEYKLTGFIDANGNYQETQFYKAFTKGGLFFLDEMDASIPEILIILNAAIANRYFDFPNGKVSANPNFRVIAAGNTVGTGADNNYTGRYCLDRASLDRFAMVNIDYSEKIEMAMADNNKNLVSFCHRFREITDKAGIECLFSYRTIDRIAKLETVINNLSEVLSISLLKGMDEDTLSILKNELSEAKDMTNNKYAKAIINGNSWDF